MSRAAEKLSTKHIIAANFATNAWSALLGFCLVPVYVRLLGLESYGLVGIYLSLTALVNILDLGLSPTITRELAVLSVTPGTEQEARDLVRTLEIIYWGLGAVLGAILLACAPLIAHRWVQAQTLSPQTVLRAVQMMSLIVAAQWPASFYMGGLMGLRRQMPIILTGIVCATLRSLGAIAILGWVSHSITLYFGWQALICAAQTLLLMALLWAYLPPAAHAARYQKRLVAKNVKFAANLSVIMLISTLFGQMDKLALTRMLPLRLFAYYAIATQVVSALGYIVGPIMQVIQPRLMQLAALGNADALARYYHKSCQTLAALLIPMTVMVCLFSEPLMRAYVHNPETTRQTHLLVSLLIAGAAINHLLMFPHCLQIAYGKTNYPLVKSAGCALALIPLLLLLVPPYGAAGCAAAILLVHLFWLCVELPWMHREILPGEMGVWYAQDFGLPLGISVAVALVARVLLPTDATPGVTVIGVGAATLLATLGIIAASPLLRGAVRRAPPVLAVPRSS